MYIIPNILTSTYEEFLERKTQFGDDSGFAPVFMPDCMFDFQRYLVEFALRGGRNAVLSDCGTGKSLMELVWAENIVRHTNKRVLVMTPNAVSAQTVAEGEKFGIEAVRSKGGVLADGKKIIVSNYEQLKHFDPNDFVAFVGDECFPGDTPIETPLGLCDIKDIRSGDEIINASGVDIVQRTSRKVVTSAVRIKTANQSFTSSPNHPYFTRRGWVNAEDIRPDDSIMETAEAMRVVWGGGQSAGVSRIEKKILQSILLREMEDATAGNYSQSACARSSCEAGRGKVTVAEGRIPQGRERTGPDCVLESNDQSRVAGQGVGVLEAHGAQANSAGRKWAWINGTTEDSFELAGAGVGSGTAGTDGEYQYRGAHLLQVGRGQQVDEDRDRGGREFSSHDFSRCEGFKERQDTGFHRVDSVEVLQPGNPELERYRDESGVIYFYDITATRHPSFSVGGLLVHNCSILKNAQGVTRNDVTEFVRHMAYRLMATATPAPNDLFEMGTISEALGHLGHMDMLNRFFKNDLNNSASGRMHGKVIEWRFKGHAEEPFYRYVCSWARAARKPSDLGFSDLSDIDGRDRPFELPPLVESEHLIESTRLRDGMLFALPAVGMREQREERRISIEERCQKVAALCEGHESSLIWCHLNPEGDLLERIIPRSIQVKGSDSDEWKEKASLWFAGSLCICDDKLFSAKLSTWRRDEKTPSTSADIILKIAQRNSNLPKRTSGSTETSGGITGLSTTPKTKTSGSVRQKNKKRSCKQDFPDTNQIQNSDKSNLPPLRTTENETPTRDSSESCQDTELPSSNTGNPSVAAVLSADSTHPAGIEEITDFTLTTATCRESSVESCAPLVILDSESSEMIQGVLKRQRCICGHVSGRRRLISKSLIFGYGMNFQSCAHQVTFPSHSFEQYYQQVRRSWRFGQTQPVQIDIVMTEGDRTVMANQRRKAKQAEDMFSKLVDRMNEAQRIERGTKYNTKMELPAWLA